MAVVTVKKSMIPIPEGIKERFLLNDGDKVTIDVAEKDKIIVSKVEDEISIVEKCFGMWADHLDIKDTDKYVRKLRSGWRRRLKRLGIEER
ncbi:MAG: hypothetical protein COS84_09085 [Armatimonadetes bacterium CG07_land_8_20_14_0_80_40_9]|nr:MAG: hypothetical protein COS84_09085 [Armatimonadetes bacterium CG07_land_8_20_14_0_80_40_9]